jgi:hypothetical protein
MELPLQAREVNLNWGIVMKSSGRLKLNSVVDVGKAIVDGCAQLCDSLIEVSPCCLRRKILINK